MATTAKKAAPKKAAVKKAAPKKAAVKNAAPTKAAAKKKELEERAKKNNGSTIKYADKSAGQPELVPIFEALKSLMLPYIKGSIEMQGGKNGQMILLSRKPVTIEGRKRDELWFAGILVQKGYVGFYFMPIYALEAEVGKQIQPEFMKLLKGKACFHIKKNEASTYEQVKKALKIGYDSYKKRGWID